MADFQTKESAYRFFDPVRFFTASDPYYWEVDNIPLKQLHENTLWLKDQLTNGVSLTNVTRSDFDELRPYANGSDRKVYVKPGRYSARINDVNSENRLQTLLRISGINVNDPPIWRVSTHRALTDTIDKVVSETASDALFLNGLEDRSFTYPALDPFSPAGDFRSSSFPILAPIEDVLGWQNTNNSSETQDIASWTPWQVARGMTGASIVDNAFLKFWRGVTRISIVDIANELSIEIPEFNIADFDYIDEDGVRQSRTNATVRIDLLFIYSKPIDVSSVNIKDPTSLNYKRTITAPELGILKGAGVILDRSQNTNSSLKIGSAQGYDENGNPQILASVADQLNTAAGFSASSVYGSFPAPDDLLNLAPLLSEQLEADNELLIGQSILPIAYIVTRASNVTIADSDIIDIRPFFRTAELSYNERAGIAASIPGISISNPVVSKLELRYDTKKIYDHFTGEINALRTTNITSVPRPVAVGYIFGGSKYGVEGAIQHYYSTAIDPTANQARLNQLIISRYGYSPNLTIPELPDWDVADWVYQNRFNLAGIYPNDYINTYMVSNRAHQFSCFGDKDTTTRLERLGTENLYGSTNDSQENYVCIHFVKKTIRLDRSNVQWMQDYLVKAQLLNCVPLSNRSIGGNQFQYAGAADIWVEKKQNEFTIYCAWVANDPFQGQNTTEFESLQSNTNGFKLPYVNRTTAKFSGFTVITSELQTAPGSSRYFPGESAAGAAIYPTVTFEVVGIPQGYSGFPSTLQGNDPVITLS